MNPRRVLICLCVNLDRTTAIQHLRCPAQRQYKVCKRRHFPHRRGWPALRIRLRPHRYRKMRRVLEGKRYVDVSLPLCGLLLWLVRRIITDSLLCVS